jgi:hypothetical protein
MRSRSTIRTLALIALVGLAALVVYYPRPRSLRASAEPSLCSSPPPPKGPAASYFEFQVERSATIPGGFPRHQRGPVAGEVLMHFVVNVGGIPELSTFKVLKASDRSLEPHARALVGSLRFHPAELAPGCPVRQLVQEVFEFDGPLQN